LPFQSFVPFLKSGIATLKAFPLPADLQSLDAQRVISEWKAQGMLRPGGARGCRKAVELLRAARHSVGCTAAVSEIKQELGMLIEAYEQNSAKLAVLDEQLRALLQEVPEAAVKPMQSIGLSPLIVAVVLANAGNLSRFAHGQQLLALAGLSLAECTSGKRKGQVVLSKRGRRQLRKYLYLAVMRLVGNNDAFKRWHAYNVDTLKMKKHRSIFKLIGKLARILVAITHTGETFDPAKASAFPVSAAA
jgi:transposase